MNREAFEQLVRETAYRPTTPEAILSELERQTLYHLEPRREGLGTLRVPPGPHGLAVLTHGPAQR